MCGGGKRQKFFLWWPLLCSPIVYYSFDELFYKKINVMNGLVDFSKEVMFPTKVPLEMECTGFDSIFKLSSYNINNISKNSMSTNPIELWALLAKKKDF